MQLSIVNTTTLLSVFSPGTLRYMEAQFFPSVIPPCLSLSPLCLQFDSLHNFFFNVAYILQSVTVATARRLKTTVYIESFLQPSGRLYTSEESYTSV